MRSRLLVKVHIFIATTIVKQKYYNIRLYILLQ